MRRDSSPPGPVAIGISFKFLLSEDSVEAPKARRGNLRIMDPFVALAMTMLRQSCNKYD